MVQMIFRYAIFIVLIIILLIMGLMFFYFTNQITYQNNKINTMFGIVSDIVHKDVQQFDIPLSCNLDQTQNSFKIPGPSYGLVDVSDSDDDSDDESDDDTDNEDVVDTNEHSHPTFTLPDNTPEDSINIQLLDITDISDENTNNDIDELVQDVNSDVKPITLDILPEKGIEYKGIIEDSNIDELNITVIHSESKQNGGNSSTHHKSLHVNELRKMAVQLQLIQNVEAKKLKKDDLIDLISKSTEAKQD
jgi:hypothetical protein